MVISKPLLAIFLSLVATTTFAGDDTAKTDTTKSSPALDQIQMVIYKNQGCTCCDKWADHLQQTNFETTIEVSDNLYQLKAKLGVHPKLSSCHTGVIKQPKLSAVKDYVFEGHVPAKFIKQFLAKPPKGAIGLSVPAMPVGSPGMEYQDKFMPYKVFLLRKNGQVTVFASVDSAEEQFE